MKKNTVLILGAGASVDYGFPSGEKLTEYIGNPSTYESLRSDLRLIGNPAKQTFLESSLLQLEKHFFQSRSLSIDRWIAKKENEYCIDAAKLLIAYFISNCEDSNFTKDGFFKKINPQNQTRDWYQLLFNAMVTDEFDDFPKTKNRLQIVTFNYDRSLEYYLYNTLSNTYIKKDEKQYREKFLKIPIIHVYGIAGGYYHDDAEYFMPYGKSKSIDSLLFRAEQIRLIPEFREHNPNLIKIKESIIEADNIYFIGFSYDELNLQILGFPFTSPKSTVSIFGTTYQMEQGEIDIAVNRVEVNTARKGGTHLKPSKLNAYTFFRNEVIKAFEF